MRHQHIAFLLVGALVGAMVTSGVYQRWPDAQTALLGNVGWLPFLVAVATLTFLGLNSRIAHQGLENTQNSLRHAQRAEVGTRYQKGLELLESGSIATRVGGIAVLRDVALAAPDQYWRSVSDVLTNLIEAASERVCEQLDAAMKNTKEEEERTGSVSWSPSLPQTPRDVVMALEVLGLKDKELRNAVHDGNRVSHVFLRRMALSNIRLYGLDMRHIVITDAYFSGVGFYNCNFDRAHVAFTSIAANFELSTFVDAKVTVTATPWQNDRVNLTRCNLTGATISHLWSPYAQVDITQCDLSRAELSTPFLDCNGCWYFGKEPSIAVPRWIKHSTHAIDIESADDLQPLEKAGGFLIFREVRPRGPDDIPF